MSNPLCEEGRRRIVGDPDPCRGAWWERTLVWVKVGRFNVGSGLRISEDGTPIGGGRPSAASQKDEWLAQR